jgi:tripartite-type tricarboxylate transporter receptor subunit TctC
MGFRLVTRLAAVLLAAAAGMASFEACAQADARNYPSKPVHVVVGNVAGSGNDLIARLFSQRLADNLGQPFLVENRPSSGSLIAGEYVARAPADGYILLFATAGLMVNSPVMYSKLAFSTERDFAPISMASKFPVVLISNAELPVSSVRELIAYAKANPKKANYGAAGAALQLAGALFKTRSDTNLEHIPYKGGSQVVSAVAAGDIIMALADAGSVTGPLRGGKLRALAVASPKRSPLLPDVPTLAEAGVRDAEIELWNGLFAPAGTPARVIHRLQDEMIRIAKLPDTRERLIALAAEPVGSTTEELAHTVSAELAKWTAVARSANIKPE